MGCKFDHVLSMELFNADSLGLWVINSKVILFTTKQISKIQNPNTCINFTNKTVCVSLFCCLDCVHN